MATAPNIAALALLIAGDGDEVFVQTVKDKFIRDASSTLVADGITVINAVGGGKWLRLGISHPSWRLGRFNWHIDSVNGNDENDGLTQATAIKTGAEHQRRWGRGNRVQQVGASDFSIHIYIYGNIAKPDYFSIDCVLAGDTEILVERGSSTTSYSGTASAVTNENQLTNTAWAITDASASLSQGQRIRWTSGVAAGATAFVAKVLGGGQWRISQTYLNTASSFGVVPIAKTPAAGDTYVVDTLPHVNLGVIRVLQEGNVIDFGVNVYFKDLQIDGPPGTLLCLNNGPTALNNIQIVFYQCFFSNEIESWACQFSNCCFSQTGVFRKPSYVWGGLFYGSSTIVEWQPGEEGQLFLDVYIQGTKGVLAVGPCTIGNVGIFDTIAASGLTGDGILVGNPATGSNSGPALVKLSGRVWGAGNAGAGINVRSGCRCIYEVIPTIMGANDFKLGGAVLAFYFDGNPLVGTPNYKPAAGQATTWALLAAAKGAPGYGGSAHNPDTDASILQAA